MGTDEAEKPYRDNLMAYQKQVVVELTFKCGHKYETLSPGVCDPAGIYADLPTAADGKVYVEDMFPCSQCK